MAVRPDIPPDLQLALDQETTGERRLWAGMGDPRQGAWAKAAAFPFFFVLLVLSIPLATIAQSYFTSNTSSADFVRSHAADLVTKTPLMLVFFLFLLVPIWGFWSVRRSLYAVTNRRIIKIDGRLGSLKVKTIWPNDIRHLERTERANGTGTVKMSLGMKVVDGGALESFETLYGLADPRGFERAVRELKERSPASAAAQ